MSVKDDEGKSPPDSQSVSNGDTAAGYSCRLETNKTYYIYVDYTNPSFDKADVTKEFRFHVLPGYISDSKDIHDWDNGQVQLVPTCTTQGVTNYKCQPYGRRFPFHICRVKRIFTIRFAACL